MRPLSPLHRVALGGVSRVLAHASGFVVCTTSDLIGLGPSLQETWRLPGVVPDEAQLTALPKGHVAVWGKDQVLKIFAAGAEVTALDHGRGWGGNQVRQVEVLNDGRLLTVDEQGLLRAWDLSDGQSVELRKEMRPPRLLGRFPDGRWALQGSQLCVVDVDAAKVDHRFVAATSISAAAVTAGGLLAIAGKYGRLTIWTPEGKKLSEVDMGGFEAVEDLLPLSDGRLLAWGEGGQVWLHDGREGALVKLQGHRGTVRHGALLSGGRAVTGGEDHALQLWAVGPGLEDESRALGAMEGHSAEVTQLLALAGGRALSAAGPELLLWDPPALNARLDGLKGAVAGALPLKDGRVVAWSKGELMLWPTPGAAPASATPPLRSSRDASAASAPPSPSRPTPPSPARPSTEPRSTARSSTPLRSAPAPRPEAPSRPVAPPRPEAPPPPTPSPRSSAPARPSVPPPPPSPKAKRSPGGSEAPSPLAARAPAPSAPRPKERSPKAAAKSSKAVDGAGAGPKASKPSNAAPEPAIAKAAAKRKARVDPEFDADLAKLTALSMPTHAVDGEYEILAERRRRSTLYAFVGGVVGSALCFPVGSVVGAWLGWQQGQKYQGYDRY